MKGVNSSRKSRIKWGFACGTQLKYADSRRRILAGTREMACERWKGWREGVRERKKREREGGGGGGGCVVSHFPWRIYWMIFKCMGCKRNISKRQISAEKRYRLEGLHSVHLEVHIIELFPLHMYRMPYVWAIMVGVKPCAKILIPAPTALQHLRPPLHSNGNSHVRSVEEKIKRQRERGRDFLVCR